MVRVEAEACFVIRLSHTQTHSDVLGVGLGGIEVAILVIFVLITVFGIPGGCGEV